MARFHLSFDNELHRKATQVCKKADLVSYHTESNSDYSLTTYSKRQIDSENFVSFDSGDWIACVGTIASDGKLGHQALVKLYDAVTKLGVEEGRNKVIGHYAVILKLDNTILMFTDPQGTINLYYSADAPVLFTNSLYLAGKCLAPQVNPMGIIEKAIELSETGEQTMFEGVHRLFGDELLSVDTGDFDIKKTKLNVSTSVLVGGTPSIEKVLSEYKSRVNSVFAQLPNYEGVGLHTTGGLDTRTVLAALLNQGIRPILMYGSGNSRLTNTKTNDLRIARQISQNFDLPLQTLDWSGTQPYSESALRSQLRTFGFNYRLYGGSHRFHDEMEAEYDWSPRLQLGGYSPAFTNMKLWEMHDRMKSTKELIDHYLHRYSSSKQFVYSQKYRSMIDDRVQTALHHSSQVPPVGMSMDEFIQARLFLYIRPEANFLNFMNQFTYYIAPFLTKQLYDPLLTMPLTYRQRDHFQFRLINELKSSVLEIPVFSGVKPAIIDTDRFVMRRPYKSKIASASLELGKKLIPEFLYPIVRPLHSRSTVDKTDDLRINRQVRIRDEQYLLNHEFLGEFFTGFNKLGLRRLDNLFKLVYAVDQIDGASYLKIRDRS